MSHLPERKEKNCLNCNAVVQGRFCHVCGQQNIEPREGFWNMLTHFVFDLFHFDGKFFSTIKFLLFKPGYLSQEHLSGRRADYLHPIRMYIFTSAFFFLLFFSFNNMEDAIQISKVDPYTRKAQFLELQELKAKYAKQIDSVKTTKAKDSLRQMLFQVNSDVNLLQTDSSKYHPLKSLGDTADNYNMINLTSDNTKYRTKAEYLASQQKLPKAKQDGYILKKIKLQQIHLNNDFETTRDAWSEVIKNFFHQFPKMLFISLPIFAFVLYLIYIRRKKYFFSDHLVYSLHLYCAFFIIILAALLFKEGFGLLGKALSDSKGKATELGSWLTGLTFFLLLFYWYKSLRRFYAQSRRKTILKFVILLFINFFVFMFLFVGFLLFSAMTS
ncbi:MAG: DUF3667 domain-containing protein [Sediminibacterium sp.]|nr:DUF3667 domain-containing protein [Sediminibacterium sp.]